MPDLATTDVLIAGAGPVGLALALELGLRGVQCVVAEKRDGRITVPKMSVVSTRNMEFCRRWGIADQVRGAVWDPDRQLDFVYVESLRGRELARSPVPSYRQRRNGDYTPEVACHCPQIYFDPILKRRVAACSSVTFSYHTSLESFVEHGGHVTARLGGPDGTFQMRAKYLVGCDGPSGIVRESLGIGLQGLGVVARSVNVFFRSAELASLHDKGWARIYRMIDETGCWAELIPIDGRELWRLTIFDVPGIVEPPTNYLSRMMGRSSFPHEVIDVSPWERRDYVAASYGRGRVFIAGDSAHQCSPTGGLGMATGIEETVNLAWKMDACLRGWGGPGLLDFYGVERQPIAARNVELSTRSFHAITRIPGWKAESNPEDYRAELDSWRKDLGAYSVPDHVKTQYTYEGSPICVSDGTPASDPEPAMFQPSARPGSRAPHVWLADGRSIFDLFDEGFTLLQLAPKDGGDKLVDAAHLMGIPMRLVAIDDPEIAALYERSFVLIRPDGHVAWRADEVPRRPAAILDLIRGA